MNLSRPETMFAVITERVWRCLSRSTLQVPADSSSQVMEVGLYANFSIASSVLASCLDRYLTVLSISSFGVNRLFIFQIISKIRCGDAPLGCSSDKETPAFDSTNSPKASRAAFFIVSSLVGCVRTPTIKETGAGFTRPSFYLRGDL